MESRVLDSITDVNETRWNTYVEQSDRGSVYYRSGWLKAVEEGYGHEARHVVVEEDGDLRGFFPLFRTRIGSTPFYQIGPGDNVGSSAPFVISSEAEVFDRLMDRARSLCSGRTVLHTIVAPSSDYMRYSVPLDGRAYYPRLLTCRFVLDLDRSWDEITSAMDQKGRRAMRKAAENGCEVRERTLTDDVLRRYYAKYRRHMDRVGGSAFPFRFIQSLRDSFPERLKFFTVFHDDAPVGTFPVLLDETRSTINGHFSAVERSDFEHRPAATFLRYLIEWGSENGYRRLNFGDSKAWWGDGSFRYKSKFGGAIRPVLRWTYLRGGHSTYGLGRYVEGLIGAEPT